MGSNYNPDFIQAIGSEYEQLKPEIKRTPEEQRLYQPVKQMKFKKKVVSIVLQNENGPCPLLAVANVLLLRGAMNLNQNRKEVHIEKLIDDVASFALESKAEDKSPVIIIPNLRYGVDVNVKFDSPESFETDEFLQLFKMLDIRLLHGWLPDPSETKLVNALKGLNHDEAMEKIVQAEENAARGTAGLKERDGDDEMDDEDFDDEEDGEGNTLSDSQLIKNFLINDNSSQLTMSGLEAIRADMKEGEICVLFRNNHFSTLFKHKGNVYSLVTDEGYKFNRQVAWEKFDNVDASELVSPKFGPPSEYKGGKHLTPHIDTDTIIARQLQATSLAKQKARKGKTVTTSKAKSKKNTDTKSTGSSADGGGGAPSASGSTKERIFSLLRRKDKAA